MTYTCPVCGETKDVGEFRKHFKEGPREPWNLRQCKQCTHEEYVARYADPVKNKALKQSSKNWKKANPDRHAALNKAWYQKNKEKARAGSKLRYAIKKGKIERHSCEVCGGYAQGHHDSYEKGRELDVRWLCQDHHKAWEKHLSRGPDEIFGSFIKEAKEQLKCKPTPVKS